MTLAAASLDSPPTVREILNPETTGLVKGVSVIEDRSYQTEFIKVYQDAGVIGAAMITLLALCVLLGVFCLRLLKMYTLLTTSRDDLETKRGLFSEKIAERLMVIDFATKEIKDDVGHICQDQSDVTDRLTRIEVALSMPVHERVRALSPPPTTPGEY